MTQRAFAIAVTIATSSFVHAQIDETRDDGRNMTSHGYTFQAPDSARLVISEVSFNPVEGDTAFVELLHVGQSPVALTSFVLQIDTVALPLPRLPTPLAPGARVLIRFDGRGTIEGNVVHTAGIELRAEGGTVSVRWNDDSVFDEIAWGDAPDAFVPTIGGMAMPGVERGSSFGRPPSANRAGAHTDWVVYAPNLVTPGQPNPLPPVSQLLPVHGAILAGTSTELMWYPVPGAVRYRVQLARDTTDVQTLLNDTVADTRINTGQLQAGLYWWRVQAIQGDGATAPWSRPGLIELGAANDLDARDDASGPSAYGDGTYAVAAPVLLPVPLILQHKDTKMLHLELRQEGRQRTAPMLPNVPHAWDRDHGTLAHNDPADNMNCTLASLAMMNRYYGGDLSQDRIGYEIWSRNILKYKSAVLAPAVAAFVGRLYVKASDFQEPQLGPERDLHYAVGMPWGRLMAAGIFALGTMPGANSAFAPPYGSLTRDSIWNMVKFEIDHRRPLLASVPGHAIVIRGYEMRGSQRLIHINDPWHSQYALDLDAAASGPMSTALSSVWPYPNARRQMQEPEVTKDTDGDDVFDFDETERFHTDPANRDTDGDGVPDKQDIASGVYEIAGLLGYAYNPGRNSKGRDYDFDGRPTELDPDSDNGGCKDGEEDENGDGERGRSETWNFDDTDDVCGNLQGSLSYLIEMVNSEPNSIGKHSFSKGRILVKLKQEAPGSRGYVDAGSTYSFQSWSRTEVVIDATCILWGREVSQGSGAFAQQLNTGAEIGAGRGDDDSLSFGALADVVSATSTGGCGPSDGRPGQSQLSWPDCTGKLAPTALKPWLQTYRFDCTTMPQGPDGWTVIRFYARGYISVY